jgi:uncharacterized protein (DUF1778 family)
MGIFAMSEFLLENELEAAQATSADRRLFILDDELWQIFQAALDHPVQEKPQLKQLLTERGFFD